jgi:hypothetical protein
MNAHVPSTISVWTKYGEPIMYGNRETDLITRIWHKFNEVSRPWKWGYLLSGDICMADMYPPWAMCGLSCIVTEKPTLSQKHDNSKSIDWKWGQVQSKEHSSYVWCQMVLWFKIRIISKNISHRVLC